MPDRDPAHWLYRLTPDEWLAAAETELRLCETALGRRALRPAVTHARRGAGMALNALLWSGERPAWARSYMEHVSGLCDDDEAPEEIRAAARQLRDTPAQPPQLVRLGPPDLGPLAAARLIAAWAAQLSRKG